MPDVVNDPKNAALLPMAPAVTQAAVEVEEDQYPVAIVKENMLSVIAQIRKICAKSPLFPESSSPLGAPTLSTLAERLHHGWLSPSSIEAHRNDEDRVRAKVNKRTGKSALNRPLEDFEDVYYALLAKMQEMHQIMNTRLINGFSELSDQVYSDGPTIGVVDEVVAEFWELFNIPIVVKSLDNAVRRNRVKEMHLDILAQTRERLITEEDCRELLTDLYNPAAYDTVPGIAWIADWSPAMINAWLEDKYRTLTKIEKEDRTAKSRAMMTKIGARLRRVTDAEESATKKLGALGSTTFVRLPLSHEEAVAFNSQSNVEEAQPTPQSNGVELQQQGQDNIITTSTQQQPAAEQQECNGNEYDSGYDFQYNGYVASNQNMSEYMQYLRSAMYVVNDGQYNYDNNAYMYGNGNDAQFNGYDPDMYYVDANDGYYSGGYDMADSYYNPAPYQEGMYMN